MKTPWKPNATAREELAQHVEHNGDWKYPGFASYLLQHGQEYAPAVPTPEETEAVRQVVARIAAVGEHFTMGQCFWNAQRVVARASRLGKPFGCADTVRVEYVEGVACDRRLTHHAWVAVNGKVLDVTYATFPAVTADGVRVPLCVPGQPVREASAVWGMCDAGTYFGVPFDWPTTRHYLQRDRRPPGVGEGMWEWGCILLDTGGELAGPAVSLGTKRQAPRRRRSRPRRGRPPEHRGDNW